MNNTEEPKYRRCDCGDLLPGLVALNDSCGHPDVYGIRIKAFSYCPWCGGKIGDHAPARFKAGRKPFLSMSAEERKKAMMEMLGISSPKADKHTFGSTLAAEILAGLIGKYPKHSKATSKAFNSYTKAMNDIMLIPARSRIAVWQCWYEKCQARVEASSLPDEIKRFLHNVIQTNYRYKVMAFRDVSSTTRLNGVKVTVRRMDGGTTVDATCHCFGHPGRAHSNPDCQNLRREVEEQKIRRREDQGVST